MLHEEKTQVARRRVFYIPGYDPYPPRRYRELYRTESQKQAGISGYQIAQKSDRSDTGWQVRAEFDGMKVASKIDVLIWHDLVKGSMRGGIPGTYLALIRTAWIYIASGTFRRLTWLAKGPVLAALYPVVMLLGQLLIAVLGALTLGKVAVALVLKAAALIAMMFGATGPGIVGTVLSTIVFWVIFLPVTIVVLRWFKAQDSKTFAYYLMQDYAYSAKMRGAYPDEIEARIHEWRHRIEAALRDDVDEVLIVGHSSGAQLAVSVVADIQRSNLFQTTGPSLGLLTLGQVIPMVSFLPDARRLRRDLRLLAAAEDVTWLDVSAPGDGCCFALSDPVSVSGVAPTRGQKWPIIISAAFSKTLNAKTRSALKWRYFRLHFQYLCAFDLPGDYDYFRITAGPMTLAQRYKDRRSSQSRIDVPASRFTSTMT
ncbi:hypothetical protein N9L47_09470 [Rhodobacteraceae bacterium]|nr:hypothetical protein [Paracoccaceae bacterium]